MFNSSGRPQETMPGLLAHLGLNHDGSLTRVLALIEMAAEAGARGVVIPLYHAEVNSSAFEGNTASMMPALGVDQQDLQFCELGVAAIEHSLQKAKAHGLLAGLQICDSIAHSMAQDLSADFHCLNLATFSSQDMLPELLESSRPLFLQMADADTLELQQLQTRISECRPTGRCDERIVLMHGAQPAPCPREVCSPQRLALVRRYFSSVGFCDHCADTEPVLAAAREGADWVTSYITLDKASRGPCHYWARDRRELQELIQSLSTSYRSAGSESSRTPSGPDFGAEFYGSSPNAN